MERYEGPKGLKSVSKYGYNIKVLWGIKFDKNPNLFTDYVK
jgi:hypothetical protein